MASLEIPPGSPRKRQKISVTTEKSDPMDLLPSDANESGVEALTELQGSKEDCRPIPEKPMQTHELGQLQEAEVGITEFVSTGNPRFLGTLKKRYTDFLVNEILPLGEVLHLDSLGLPPKTQREADGRPSQKSTTAAVPSATEEIVEDGAEKNFNEKNESPPNPSKEIPSPSVPSGTFKLSSEDEAELSSYIGSDALQSVLTLHQSILQSPGAKSKSVPPIVLPSIDDRKRRTAVHQSMRRMFSSRLETSTDDSGIITVFAASSPGQTGSWGSRPARGQPRPRDKPERREKTAEHLHFTLYKENKDTMEVISFLAYNLRLPPKSFQFAGTKDRRAVTVQRASVYRTAMEKLAGLNRSLRGAKLGGFKYQPSPLALGDLAGNEFVITLRECSFRGLGDPGSLENLNSAAEIVKLAVQDLNEKGFINYYGLQRFGAFSARTDTVGVKMLQGDFEGACQDILSYNPTALAASSDVLVSRDDKARAKALHSFKTTGKAIPALDDLPRKFSAETALIRYLGGHGRSNDYYGALQAIPRNLRLMYVHAYQSLVWNASAGERWKRYGNKVIEGDLILLDKAAEHVGAEERPEEVDESGEVVVKPVDEGLASSSADPFQRARRLSKEEAESGIYGIFDVVLPTPGFDIVYPGNSMETFYKDFMGSERGGGLDPFAMRRKWKDVSLSGSYRKILARPLGTGVEFELKMYHDDDEQMVKTDLQKVEKSPKPNNNGRTKYEEVKTKPETPVDSDSPEKIAVILKLQLGTSQYATMALRELMGLGGVKLYKPDYGGGR